MKKNITVNSIFNVAYKIIATIYPLIAVSYVSHILQSDRIGTVSYAQNIVTWFAFVAGLGLPFYGTREIAKCKDDKDERSKSFWELFSINAVSTIFAVSLFLILSFSIPKFRENIVLYLVCGLQIVFNFFNIDWLYQGIEEYSYISIRSTIIKLISLVALFIFVRSKNDYIIYALINVLGLGGNYLLNIIHSRRIIYFKKYKLEILKHIKPVLILMISSFAVETYSILDTLVLGIYYGDSIVGCYSNAMKLSKLVVTLCTAIGSVLLPRLTVIYEEKKYEEANELINKTLKLMLFFALPASVGLMLLSEPIVLVFFGDSFMESIDVLKILSLLIPFIVTNSLLGAQVLISSNMERKFIFSVLIGCAINLFLNFIFIPRFGLMAAALTSLASEIVVLVFYLVFTRKIISITFSIKYILSILLSLTLYVLLYFFLLRRIQVNNILFISINVGICIFLYFGICLLFKNESIMLMLYKVLNRIKKR